MAPSVWLCHRTVTSNTGLPVWLNSDERARASKLSAVKLGEFLSSRWLIRQALAGASGELPGSCIPCYGRPVRSHNPSGWRLSLSHSRRILACATNLEGEIGLDIEPGNRRPNWQRVAQRWFSPVEQEWLLAEGKARNFLKVWTLKEAWLKATGRGIAGNLQTLEVRRKFELYADRCDNTQPWQACCTYVDGFLVTLVYRQTAAKTSGASLPWPSVHLLEPPADDYQLTPAGTLNPIWDPLFQRPIQPMAARRR